MRDADEHGTTDAHYAHLTKDPRYAHGTKDAHYAHGTKNTHYAHGTKDAHDAHGTKDAHYAHGTKKNALCTWDKRCALCTWDRRSTSDTRPTLCTQVISVGNRPSLLPFHRFLHTPLPLFPSSTLSLPLSLARTLFVCVLSFCSLSLLSFSWCFVFLSHVLTDSCTLYLSSFLSLLYLLIAASPTAAKCCA